MIDRPNNINLFILYAAEDEDLKSELERHLSMLKRTGYIDVWHEGQMSAGDEKDHFIRKHLNKSHLILLLISSNFLDPDCYGRYEEQLRLAYERQKKGEVKIIPVILRDCLWKMDLLSSLNPLPKGGHSVISKHWKNMDTAYLNITTGLKQIVDDLLNSITKTHRPITKPRPKTKAQPTPSIPKKEKIETDNYDQVVENNDQVAINLINELFNLFQKLDQNTCAQMSISIVHKSLIKMSQLEQRFLKHKFLKAYNNAHLYVVPIQVQGIKKTNRTSIGQLSEKEKGKEVMYEIAKKQDLGSLPGHVRIFFPSDGGLPKISNLSL